MRRQEGHENPPPPGTPLEPPVPHFIVNICGGFLNPDKEQFVEGTVYGLDPHERWVAKAVFFRHLVETSKEGVPLSRAPAPRELPSRLEEIAEAGDGRRDRENEWLEKLLFG